MPADEDKEELPPQQSPEPAAESDTDDTPDVPLMPLPEDPAFRGTVSSLNVNPPELMDADALEDAGIAPQQGDTAAGEAQGEEAAIQADEAPPQEDAPAEAAEAPANEDAPVEAAEAAPADVPPSRTSAEVEESSDAIGGTGGEVRESGEGTPGEGDAGRMDAADSPTTPPSQEEPAPDAGDTETLEPAEAQVEDGEKPAPDQPAPTRIPLPQAKDAPDPQSAELPDATVADRRQQPSGCDQAEKIEELQKRLEELTALVAALPDEIVRRLTL